jgi:CheY-like chemotaxis protein
MVPTVPSDDQPDIGLMARGILEPAGCVVLLTSDPLEAIRMARHRKGDIDLLLIVTRDGYQMIKVAVSRGN